MMTQKPQAKFRAGQRVLHKVRYWVNGVEKIKWEPAKILEKKCFKIKEGTYEWGYRISGRGLFPTFESESEFKTNKPKAMKI